MELREFIQTALGQIISGVKDAKKKRGSGKVTVGLEVLGLGSKVDGEIASEASDQSMNRIQFNVSYPKQEKILRKTEALPKKQESKK